MFRADVAPSSSFQITRRTNTAPIVSVVPLTSKVRKRRLPTHVSRCAAGLPVRSLALCEQLTVIDKRQLTTRVGTVNDPFDRAAINRAMAVQLGMAAA